MKTRTLTILAAMLLIVGIWFAFAQLEVKQRPVMDCEYEEITIEKTTFVEKTKEVCYDTSVIDSKGNNVTTGRECKEVSYKEPKTVKKTKKVCKKGTKKIKTEESTLEFEKNNLECTILEDRIECDEKCFKNSQGKRECPDSNGDGVCQKGETCFVFPLQDNKLSKAKVTNGKYDVTYKQAKKLMEVSE